jgi:hypothetical protein
MEHAHCTGIVLRADDEIDAIHDAHSLRPDEWGPILGGTPGIVPARMPEDFQDAELRELIDIYGGGDATLSAGIIINVDANSPMCVSWSGRANRRATMLAAAPVGCAVFGDAALLVWYQTEAELEFILKTLERH